MKLIYIRSAMEPKNYAAIRSILKQEQGEKVAPYVFKLNNTEKIAEYLDKERINYETYGDEKNLKEKNTKTILYCGNCEMILERDKGFEKT